MGLKRRRKVETRQPPTVLLVEPRGEQLEATRAALGEAGFRVVGLGRFEAAVALYQVLRPDAVVLAAEGPDFAALSVARRVAALGRGAVPLVYLVGADDGEARARVLERGLGADLAPRDRGVEELALRLHAQLKLARAVRRAERADADAHVPHLRDPLTGAFHRAYLLAALGHERRRAERFGGGFSVLVCAPRELAQVRKALGRAAAERLMVYGAAVLGQTVREADVLARVDDGAFAVLLPGAPAEAVEELAGRVRARFESARFQLEGRVVRLPVEVGAVSFPDTTGTPAQLLEAAFRQLRRERAGVPPGPRGAARARLTM